MKKRSAAPAVLLASLAVLFGSCRGRQSASRGEQVAETMGRDEAVYTVKPGGADTGRVLTMAMAGIERPSGPAEFVRFFHLPPVRQGETGTCWAFAATSLLESELRRMGKAEVKLSEMHTVYWEYVEKARRFVREKGNSFLGEGSEPNSALQRVAEHGVVPASAYSGLPDGRTGHDHRALFREFKTYLTGLADRGAWDEEASLAGVRTILDKHLGRPPETIRVDGRAVTPKEYSEAVLGLVPADYVAFISFAYAPFHERAEFEVPDNWWHSGDYLNLPLLEFRLALLRALRKGYTAALAVDFSEPGYSGADDLAVVPSFDIPRNFIDQSSREMRFASGSTTDDHSVHCVGYKDSGAEAWFLIKDSWANAWEGPNKGYFFYRDDYVRLKCLMFVVHKDAVRDVLAKFAAAGED
jgi:bleomycin hydrolase